MRRDCVDPLNTEAGSFVSDVLRRLSFARHNNVPTSGLFFVVTAQDVPA